MPSRSLCVDGRLKAKQIWTSRLCCLRMLVQIIGNCTVISLETRTRASVHARRVDTVRSPLAHWYLSSKCLRSCELQTPSELLQASTFFERCPLGARNMASRPRGRGGLKERGPQPAVEGCTTDFAQRGTKRQLPERF